MVGIVTRLSLITIFTDPTFTFLQQQYFRNIFNNNAKELAMWFAY